MPRTTVMIRVNVATRDRLAAVQHQMTAAQGGRRKLKSWYGRRRMETLNAALVELLDQHDRHRSRNKRATEAARAKRRAAKALADSVMVHGDGGTTPDPACGKVACHDDEA